MELPLEFVELLETHAEISIRDHVARKRFTLEFVRILESRELQVWLPLTLEPGQRIVGCSCATMTTSEDATAWLGIPGGPSGERFRIEFETLESLTPEAGRFRVETFNAFLSQESARLVHRTVKVRIDSPLGVREVHSPTHPVLVRRLDLSSATLQLDLRGDATRGRFRFFYSLGKPAPFRQEAERVDFDGSALEPASPVAAGDSGPTDPGREFLEPRRSRPRRRASLRRST
ncbi:MAG: hypothetical protein HY293_02430 [Planctomycetes bacterium]|nr:hypothetical protein [Planctomycetota bacterium]